jgi:hypothetical protein
MASRTIGTMEGRATRAIAADDGLRWRDAIVRIVAVFVATRLIVLLVALVLEGAIPLAYHGPTFSAAPVLRSLTGEDSIYYLGIASDGYHLQPVANGHFDWAFFPLYPLATRIVALLLLGNVPLAGVLVSNAAFLAALVVVYRLGVGYLGHDRAVRSVVFLAIAPGAVAFAFAYTDSLFLLVAAGAFLAAERRQLPLAGLLYGLASLCRLPGVALGLPLLAVLMAGGARPTRSWLWLALGPLALLAFYGYLGAITGDVLANIHAQATWDIAPILGAPKPVNVTDTPVAAFSVLPLLLIGTLLVYVFLFVYMRGDRIPLPYALLAAVSIGTVIASLRLQSVARYLVVAWPFSWVLASRRSAWFRDAWPAVSTGLFAIHAFLNISQALAP